MTVVDGEIDKFVSNSLHILTKIYRLQVFYPGQHAL